MSALAAVGQRGQAAGQFLIHRAQLLLSGMALVVHRAHIVRGRLGKLESGAKAIYNPHYEIQR